MSAQLIHSDVYCSERKRVESVRLELLEAIFGDVSAAHQNEATAASNKALRLWSSEDMETLVDLVVRITNEIQQTGRSNLINYVADTLRKVYCVIILLVGHVAANAVCFGLRVYVRSNGRIMCAQASRHERQVSGKVDDGPRSE